MSSLAYNIGVKLALMDSEGFKNRYPGVVRSAPMDARADGNYDALAEIVRQSKIEQGFEPHDRNTGTTDNVTDLSPNAPVVDMGI